MKRKLLAYLLSAVMVVMSVPAAPVKAAELPVETAIAEEMGEDATEQTEETQEHAGSADTEDKSEAATESETETKSSSESESESGKKTESESESGTNQESGSESGAASENETETQTEELTETETETEIETVEEIKIISENALDEYPNPVIPFKIDGTDIFAGLNAGEEYNKAAPLPEKYDPRIDAADEMTSVKNQNPWSTCCSFAMMDILQNSMIRQNFADNSIDLSERHMAYFMFNTGYDALDNANDDTIVCDSDTYYLEQGGNACIAAMKLMNWHGAAYESAYPYSNSNTAPSRLNNKTDAQNAAVMAQDIYFIPTSDATIEERKSAVKQLIQEYGCVEWSYGHLDDQYNVYNAGTYSYYNPCSGANHEIVIVGWDDNFPKTNFNAVSVQYTDGSIAQLSPENNGAWIVKNSWGTTFGDGGYFYISYEDASLGSGNPATVAVAENKNTYDNNYLYGNTSSFDYRIFDSGEKIAQIFKAKSSYGKEKLTAVSMMLASDNISYSIQIYKNPQMSEGIVRNPESGECMLSEPVTGQTGYAGLHTIVLPEPVTFQKDDYMSVVIEFKSDNAGVFIDISDTESYDGINVIHTNTVHAGQSLWNPLYNDEYSWYDVAYDTADDGYNFRINALTRNVDADAYLIRFYDYDGKLIEEKEVKKGGICIPPADPERAGYKFVGWKDENGEEFEAYPEKDTAYTAQYELTTYTITYVLDGGINAESNPDEYTIESETILLAEPKKDDCEFMGWVYIDQETQSECTITEIVKGSTGDITLYAQWGQEGMELQTPTFQPASGILEEGRKLSIRSMNPDADIYYTLDGSVPTAETGIKYTDSFELPANTPIETEIEVNAIAVRGEETSKIATATYTYIKVRLILKREKITVKVGSTYAIGIEQFPTGSDESMVNWSSSDEEIATVSEQGVVTAVKTGTAVITAQTTDYKNRTVIAACEVTVGLPIYTVIFYDADGNQIGEPQQVAEGKSAISPQAPERKGYKFAGWSGSYTNVRRNLSLRAEYEPAVYKITYELNGGESVESNPTEYTIEKETILLNASTKNKSFFRGWYADRACETEEITEITKGSTGDLTLYAKWFTPAGLWMTDIALQTYTGSAIEPDDFIVYDAVTPLTAGVDYTVSYKNNVKAYEYDARQETSARLAPTIVVKGKGNYTGTISQCFTIKPVDISEQQGDCPIQIDDITVAYMAGKTQTPSPIVQWGDKKLAAKKDYIVEAPENCREPDTYEVKVKGIGNFTGERTIAFTIASGNQKPISAVKVSKIKDQTYTGKAITITEDMLKLKDGSYELQKGTDYTIDAGKYIDAGTYSFVVRGSGSKYVGIRRLTFKIKGTAIKTAKVGSWGKDEFVYSGKEQKPKPVLTAKGENLQENRDYTILGYENCTDAGTGKVLIAGKGAYSGTAAYSFKIKPAKAEGMTISFVNGSNQQAYEKNGVNPRVTVSFNGQLLSEGADYKLSYKNNAVYPQKAGKDPQVIVSGKKNFTGSKSQGFTIVSKKLSEIGLVFAADIEESKKPGKFYSIPQLYDTNGNKLAAGKDYEKAMVYKNKSGKTLEKTDQPPANSEITVEITGKGAYEGQHRCTYQILPAKVSIAKAKVSLLKKIAYTGEEITLTNQDIQVTLDGKNLTLGTNYKVEPYPNNPKKGKLKFLLKGAKPYGGTKTITVTVNAQGMKWWQ